ncbi:hypothetical protein [Azospirillum isscasi]|uniref:Uncharacterized protein n=1 Tax=Azospirillum isscasi TaxID=3053926 RepID=A0ABU0WQN2_9PROT|nr:hypothetical protein [Azospirillum isscasi]MDQ2106555.1 hypothetical protein [Azospirillum isscasi]
MTTADVRRAGRAAMRVPASAWQAADPYAAAVGVMLADGDTVHPSDARAALARWLLVYTTVLRAYVEAGGGQTVGEGPAEIADRILAEVEAAERAVT